MKKTDTYDDEVTIIGGSEWQPDTDTDRSGDYAEGLGNGSYDTGKDVQGSRTPGNEERNGKTRDDEEYTADGGEQTVKWKLAAIISASACVLLAAFLVGKHLYFKSQFPKSRPDKEIIEALAVHTDNRGAAIDIPEDTVRELSGNTVPDRTVNQGIQQAGKPGVEFSQTISMGVVLRKYALNGLKAHFADTVPDCSDSSVFLVTRSADYRIKNDRRAIIGDFIQNGEILSKSNWRAGFMAVADGNAQIGISRSSKVRRYVLEQDGSFFRQLAIVSAGTRCDRQFILKGKVTRCAYARDENGMLYFIETANPETLYGFADALIEDGFIDAVYVTGGAQADLFFREADGTAHGSYTDDKPHKLVVWTRQLP